MIRDYFRQAFRTALRLAYARRNYKLFLNGTFSDLTKDARACLCSLDLFSHVVRPIEIRAPFGCSMLVIAPHQDDEIIGCGGAMVLQSRAGKAVRTVFVQDGGDEHAQDGMSREQMVGTREAEASLVAGKLGLPAPTFLRHKTMDDSSVGDVAKDLCEVLLAARPDCVFVPFFLDYSPHHQITSYALAEALATANVACGVFNYEVWGLCVPNVVLNIDSVIDVKREVLGYYRSQTAGTDYVNWVTGLNMYHSRAFGAGVCRYAERFFEMPSAEYVSTVRSVRAARSQ